MLLKCCIICYRKLDEDVSVGKCSKNRESGFWNVNGEETAIIVSKFFQFLERYLDDSEVGVAEGKDGSRKHSTGVIKAMLKGGMLGSCGDCLKLLNEFCEIYHRMKEMELMLNWKLWTIKNIMGSARKVGARIAIFRESVRNLVDVGNADEIANAIFVFKKETNMKCKLLLRGVRKLLEIPKVKIQRYPLNATSEVINADIEFSGVQQQSGRIPNEENEIESSTSNPHPTDFFSTLTTTGLKEENESCFDIGSNIHFQTNSQLATAAPTTATTTTTTTSDSIEDILVINSTEEITQAIFSQKIETAQEEDPTCTGTKFKSCENYSTCSSISSATANKSSIAEDSHNNNERVPDKVLEDEPDDTGPSVSNRFASSGSFKSPGNISLNIAEVSFATVSIAEKSTELEPRLSSYSEINEENSAEDQIPHDGLNEVDLNSKNLQLSPFYDTPAKAESKESSNEETGPETAKSPILKCSEPFSTEMKLAEHPDAHETEGDSESGSCSFCDSLSELEEEEEDSVDTEYKTGLRASDPNGKSTNEKYLNGCYPCKINECTKFFRSNEKCNEHKKLHGEYICRICKKAFGYAPELAIHELTEHPIIPGDAEEKIPKNMYYCPRPRCVFALEGRETYIRHYLWAHCQLTTCRLGNLTTITCNICKLIVHPAATNRRKLLVQSHHRSHHHSQLNKQDNGAPQKIFKCNTNFCTAHFKTETQLIIHTFKIHGIESNTDGSGSDALANTTENTRQSLVEPDHKKSSKVKVKGRKKAVLFCCHFCEVKSSYAPEIALHEVTQHSPISTGGTAHPPNIYKCPRPKCVFTVEGKVAFTRHHVTQHLKLKYFKLDNLPRNACSICNTAFTINRDLHLHYERQHNMKTPGTEVHRCWGKDCAAYFVTPRHLNIHQTKMHGIMEKNYKCDICNKMFQDRCNLKHHRKSVHIENVNLLFRCSIKGCKKSFETERELQGHVKWCKNGSNLKLYHCQICEKPIRGKLALAWHVKIHSNRKKPKKAPGNFVCEKCGKKFMRKDRLDQHSLSHSGPSSWQFSCSVCQKKCSTKHKLEEHMRTHTKEKPFVCDICGEKYAHRHNLRIHVNSKHGDVVKDLPRHFDKANLTSRKGVKRKKPVEPEEMQSETD